MVDFSLQVEILIFGLSSLAGIVGLFWRIALWQAEMRLRDEIMQKSQDQMDARMQELVQKGNERASKMHTRFDAMDAKMDNRFDAMERKHDDVERRVTRLEVTVEQVQKHKEDSD